MCGYGAGCPDNDAVCQRDWIGFEAIAQLHAQIDDDHNGSLDRLESDEVNVSYIMLFYQKSYASVLHLSSSVNCNIGLFSFVAWLGRLGRI